MTDREDIDILAAEYVLGTLDAGERTAVSARRRREAPLEAAIGAWETRLSPLIEAVPAVPPPPGLLERIETRLDAGTASASPIIDMEKRTRRWRGLALTASAAAAALLVTIGVREMSRPQMPKNYVAVFQKDDASPAFLLSIDLETRRLSIRPVAAQQQPDKSYQLWIASDSTGGVPQSLGLIEDQDQITQRVLTAFDRAVVERATFGVSLEPKGGSPTGKPTGPVFHAKLVQTSG